MNKHTIKKKKMETSKALLLYSDALSFIVLVVAIIAVFCSENPEPLAYLIPATFGLSTASHSFYYWKAKAENLNKWGKNNLSESEVVDDELVG